jgi:arginyl-tRNA--protein-N-Asp/Glu arginylyltransferase
LSKHFLDAPQFYLTTSNPCPYLPGQKERKVFTHLVGPQAPHINNTLSQGGFRRSQSIIYRPACEQCQACISVRVCVDDFEPKRSFRKIIKKNRDLIGIEKDNIPTSEQYSLFSDYLDYRHGDGGMASMSVLDYAVMVEDSHVNTHLLEYRLRTADSGITGKGSELKAVVLFDRLQDGLSMVYSFFDPQEDRRSLGTFVILDMIARARREGRPYLYLGYWVRGSAKMGYKGRFLPQERLLRHGWQRVDEET